MAGTKVNAATLINTVKYESDRASLRRVRMELRTLKEMSSKNSVAQAKAEVKAAKEAADQEIKQAKRVIQFHQQQQRKAGTGPLSNKTYDPKTVDRQNRAMAQAAQRDISAQLKQREREEKARAKARQEALNRDVGAQGALVKSAFDLNRMEGLGVADRYKAVSQAKAITQAYREGRIELSEQNEQLRQLRLNTSAQARQARRAARIEGKQPRKGNSNTLALGALLGSPLGSALGIGGAGYFAVNATREAVSGAVERQQGRMKMESMGLDPLSAMALKRSVMQRTGFDLSDDKLADISKDVQDKQGQLSQGQWKQNKKTGDWNFSGGGELSAWANMMITRGGYGREEAINTLQGAKGPVELGIILNNLKKSAKLTDQEFTALNRHGFNRHLRVI